ncbi:GNAT family N-acetyltransferase [Luteipulveratus halotolerans]|uniref:N-acetyltransferase domain-containing protein n=1 Tax=Luteipulveratus halotolerans TaxID=1631356 RepID=A0A0L6CI27_9MICO|nr:GNAT family N-acetyltransferase [Luteipulveratus halotolerans]KNX37173.1 hypothetical protein VV01_08465 [Luteipulveratus halotolerans]
MSSIRITRATAEDAFALAALVLRADLERGASGRTGFIDEYADAWLAERDRRPAWIATEPDGDPAGLISTSVVRRLPSLRRPASSWMHVSLLYVVPNQRGQGLGEQLLRRMIVWGEGNGVDRFQLNAVPEARTLYERVGFTAPDPRLMERRR